MSVDTLIIAFLKLRIGLDVTSIGMSAIDRAVRQRLAATKLTEREPYWQLLQSSNAEQQALIEAVVVPETWFFRYPESFTALAELAIKQLANLNRPLRLLSAPCATGEEPYSIAMALLDAGLTAAQFTIDAVDISPPLIVRASAGLYGKNSFRGEFQTFRERHFSETADGYSLSPRVRSQVSFRTANLMNPVTLGSSSSYDFVFCRNVLIYFDVPTQESVLRTLIDLAHKTGYLFVGPAEASLLSRQGLQAIGVPLSFAFQQQETKPKAATATTSVYKSQPAPTAAKPSVRHPPTVAHKPLTKTPRVAATPAAVKTVASVTDDLSVIAGLANAGRIDEALRHCRQQLERHGPSAPLFYWFGLLNDTAGKQSEALDFYRKALYLDPQHRETLAHLAALLEARGDVAGARRFQARAARGVNKHG
jgi:chemotaxis protein methyltransferase WspC